MEEIDKSMEEIDFGKNKSKGKIGNAASLTQTDSLRTGDMRHTCAEDNHWQEEGNKMF